MPDGEKKPSWGVRWHTLEDDDPNNIQQMMQGVISWNSGAAPRPEFLISDPDDPNASDIMSVQPAGTWAEAPERATARITPQAPKKKKPLTGSQIERAARARGLAPGVPVYVNPETGEAHTQEEADQRAREAAAIEGELPYDYESAQPAAQPVPVPQPATPSVLERIKAGGEVLGVGAFARGMEKLAGGGGIPAGGIAARGTQQAQAEEQRKADLSARATPVEATDPIAAANVQRQGAWDELQVMRNAMLQAAMAGMTAGGAVDPRVRKNFETAVINMNTAQEQYNQTYDMEVQALHGIQASTLAQANIASEVAAKQARIIRDKYAQEQAAYQRAGDDVGRRIQTFDDNLTAIRDRKVDPAHVFQSASTGSKVAFVFGAMLDGFLRGQGVQTGFWDNINKIMDADIAAQENALARSEGALEGDLRGLAAARQVFSDRLAQIGAAKAAEIEGVIAIAESFGAKVSGTKAKAQVDQIIAQLRRQQAAERVGVAQNQVQASARAMRRGDTLAQAGKLIDMAAKIDKMKGDAEAAGYDPKVVERMAEKYRPLKGADQSFKRLMTQVQRHGVPTFVQRWLAKGAFGPLIVPKEDIKTYGAITQAFVDYRRVVTGAQAAFAELKWIENAFGGISQALTGEEVLDRLQNIQQSISDQIDTVYMMGRPAEREEFRERERQVDVERMRDEGPLSAPRVQ
jgi:hypothetical protein